METNSTYMPKVAHKSLQVWSTNIQGSNTSKFYALRSDFDKIVRIEYFSFSIFLAFGMRHAVSQYATHGSSQQEVKCSPDFWEKLQV